MKAVVAAFNQEKALVGAFSVITNLRMQFGCNFLEHYYLHDKLYIHIHYPYLHIYAGGIYLELVELARVLVLHQLLPGLHELLAALHELLAVVDELSQGPVTGAHCAHGAL